MLFSGFIVIFQWLVFFSMIHRFPVVNSLFRKQNNHIWSTLFRTSTTSFSTSITSSSSSKITKKKATEFESFFTRENVPDETLFIIDGTSLIFRAYHSEKKNNVYSDAILSESIVKEILQENEIQLMTEDGILIENGPVSCSRLVSVVSRLVQVIDEIKPRYLAVVFDAGSITFRNEIYPEYKQQRLPRPPDMAILFHLIPRIFKILGCECLQQSGYEADDVMATLGVWGRTRGLNVVHVSQDKDMLQLVAPGVHVFSPFKREYISESEAIEMMGLHPTQLTDYWALTGDASDNIPGVDSIGPKVARHLIQYFGTLDQMLLKLGLQPTDQSLSVPVEEAMRELTAALEGVRASKEKVYNNLKKSSSSIPLFKQLVTLRSDVPIAVPDHWQAAHTHMKYDIVEQFTPRIDDGISALDSGKKGSANSDSNSEDITAVVSESITIKSSTKISVQVDTDIAIKKQKQEVQLDEISTQQFRYRGESVSSDAVVALKAISAGLVGPLNSLRYSYRKLDREL